MKDDEKVEILQKELRALEEENTRLRQVMPPPANTAHHEVERLIFQVRQLHAQVERCESMLRHYQERIRDLTSDFYRRHPPKAP